MKKLVKETNLFINHESEADKERLVIAYVCAEAYTQTEKLYKDIVFVTLNDTSLLASDKFAKALTALAECIQYAVTDRYLEIIDVQKMVSFLRAIKYFEHKGVEVKFDEILKEIIEPEKIHKFKKIMDQVDELMKDDLNVISFKK